MKMDELQTVVNLISQGGPVVTIFAVWVAFKAGQTAKEAVAALKEMRDLMKKGSETVSTIDARTKQIEQSLEALPAKLKAA
jgi:hypothetical protein